MLLACASCGGSRPAPAATSVTVTVTAPADGESAADAGVVDAASDGDAADEPAGAGHGVVRSGPATVTGKLPPEVIQRIVQDRFGDLHACYEPVLARDPFAAGTLRVKFTVGADGRVRSLGLSGATTENSRALGTCVLQVLRRMRFPAPPGGGTVDVAYSLVFSP